jgi:hypothetical protein
VPRRDDVHTILVIGSGPIVIGQACEFDYSGTQACEVLRRLGYRVVLVNSNPATIMTDPELADATYVEPLTLPSMRAVIEREHPDALLPTLGGQTGLNLSVALAEDGTLGAFGVRLIGAGLDAIRRAEDRRLFVRTMREAGLPLPASGFSHTVGEGLAVADDLGYPVIVRPRTCWGEVEAVWPWIAISCAASPPTPWQRALSARCWLRSPSPDGRSSSSRSCGTAPTTPSWCVRSRTWTPWACTRGTRSPWPRPRRSPTVSISACGITRSRASGPSGSRPEDRMSSSGWTPGAAISC